MSALQAHGLVRPDDWLAGALGVPAFAVGLPPDAQSLRDAMATSCREASAFFYAKVPVRELEAMAALQAAGFRLVDTQVTFEYRGAGAKEASPLRLAQSADRDSVLEIAGSCFEFSRFHQDARIGRQRADRVKREWARSCLDGTRGDGVLVAEGGGRVAGFLAVKASTDAGGTSAAIDLVGVDRPMQGRRLGTALVEAFVGRWHGRASRLLVGTQLANAASIRLYEQCGFRFRDAAHVLHAHVEAGR